MTAVALGTWVAPVTVQAEPPPRLVAAVTSAVMSPSAYWLGLTMVTEPLMMSPVGKSGRIRWPVSASRKWTLRS